MRLGQVIVFVASYTADAGCAIVFVYQAEALFSLFILTQSCWAFDSIIIDVQSTFAFYVIAKLGCVLHTGDRPKLLVHTHPALLF